MLGLPDDWRRDESGLWRFEAIVTAGFIRGRVFGIGESGVPSLR
jgi:hypothetical protein